jgi:hypothetical protein
VKGAPDVAINGVPAGGQMLTAVPGAWPVTGVSNSYQWYYCPDSSCTDPTNHADYVAIPKATKSTLKVESAWERVFARVTGKKKNFATATTDSADVDVSDGTDVKNYVSPSIKGVVDGDVNVGQKLTVTPGIYSRESLTRTYQWEAQNCAGSSCVEGDWAPVSHDADGTTFIPTGIDFAAGNVSLRVVESAAGADPQSSAAVTLDSGTVTVVKKPSLISSKTEFEINGGTLLPSSGSEDVEWLVNGAEAASPVDEDGVVSRRLIAASDSVVAEVTYSGVAGYTGYSDTIVAQKGAAPTKHTGAIVGSALGEDLTAPDSADVFTYVTDVTPTITYQWYSNGSAIKSATHSSYVPTSGYVGKKITVKETASSSFYSTASSTSSSLTLAKGSFGTPSVPEIGYSYPLVPGKVVTAVAGAGYSMFGSLSYQWQRNSGNGFGPVAGATKSTYTTTAADAGTSLRVIVTSTKTGYTTSVLASDPVDVGYTGELENLVPPVIDGVAKVGGVLTADAGDWNAPGVSFTYQWYRNGIPIPGATSAIYTPTATNYGDEITAEVTAGLGGYSPSTASSDNVTVGLGDLPTPTYSATITVSGDTYTVSAPKWSVDGLTVTYQWQLNGTDINHSASNTYTKTGSASGVLSVVITASRFGYPDATVTVTGPTLVPEL